MEQIIQLPSSMNLTEVKQTALPDMKANFLEIPSNNRVYAPRDTIQIEIPTGAKGTWLHAQDSYISYRFKPSFTCAAGQPSLDGTAFSIIKTVKVRHSSNYLVNQQNANRLYNALYDIQVGPAERNVNTIGLGVQNSTVSSVSNNLYGLQFAKTGDANLANAYYGVAHPLICSVVGSLQDHAIPLGWLNSAPIVIELEVEDMNKMITTRRHNNLIDGAAGQSTALTLTGFEITDVVYHAKVSVIPPMYDDALLQALGTQIILPSVEWRADQTFVPAGTTNFQQNFSLQYTSVKALLWWLTNSATAEGIIATHNLACGITQRQSGDLKNYNIKLNGSAYPSQPIVCDYAGAVSGDGLLNGSMAFQELMRCFNLTSKVAHGGALTKSIYGNKTDTIASDLTTTKRFIGALDLSRTDANESKIYEGINTMNSQVALNLTFNTALTENQNLYLFVLHDVGYVIQDGMIVART